MAEKMGIYKCMKCGVVAEIIVPSGVSMECCGSPMTLLSEKNKDGAGEKHLPVVESTADGILVKVGVGASSDGGGSLDTVHRGAHEG